MAFDISTIENGVRQEIEEQVRERVLSALTTAKDLALGRLEEVKNELNHIDAEIAARTPVVTVEVVAEG